MKKYFYLFIFMLTVSVFKLDFVYEEININQVVYLFANNLYINDITVGTEKTAVIDFYLKDDRLIIIPEKEEVRLPISGLITEIGNNYVLVESNKYKYKVYNIKSKYYLYQYYTNNSLLGYSNEIVIESSSYIDIIDNLIIDYEEI